MVFNLVARLARALVTSSARLPRSLRGDALKWYRPERHYMRGPGPKWQEKYGELAVRSSRRTGM
jgi:hypothetical protein